MPKIPTFKATGSIEQLAGTTSNIQVGLNNNLASALAPVTKAIVDFKIKENDIQNRTEALKLKNDYLSEVSDIEDQINQDEILSVNKNAANKYLKEKNNALIEKYSALATTSTVKTMFTNSALADVSKQIFSIDSQISRNILVKADDMFADSKEKLFSKAYLKGGIYKETLQADAEKLIIDSYKSRVTAPELQKMLDSVPSEIQMFDGIEMVSKTPRAAFYFLKDEKNLPNITYKQRINLIERASVVIREQITTEWENYKATIAAGKDPPRFDMKLAVDVFDTRVGEKMVVEDTFTKDRVKNNAVINNSPNNIVGEVVQGFIDEGYEMYGQLQGAENEKYLKDILIKREKAMKSDPVAFYRATDSNIESLYEEMQNDDNGDSIAATKKILTETLIQKQKDMGVGNSAIRITSKSEINEIKNTITNNDIPYVEKKAFIDNLPIIYGKENMSKVLNHLQYEKLPIEYIVAISTNSDSLTEDILSGEKIDDLKKIVSTRLDSGVKFNSIEKKVTKGMEDWEDVIIAQGEGSVVKTNYILSVQAAIYKSALQRIKRGDSISDAVGSAVTDFTQDYYVAPAKTYFIPSDVNGVRTLRQTIENKAEAILLEVETGDYVDRFHGKDGYMHYAKFAGIENLSEKMVKERITSTIKNHSKWLLNGDSTGIVLNAEFANGTYPITNSNGQKIEFFFTDTPNDKNILSTEFKFPVTGDDITMIEYVSDIGAYEFEDANNKIIIE